MPAKYYPTEDPFLNASRGLIFGGSVRNIFGKSANSTSIVTGSYRAPWEVGADYTFPSEPLQMSVTSDIGANTDDGVTVLISGLDADYNVKTEVATIEDGVPYVTEEFLRINDAIVTSGMPQGNVVIANTGTTYARINAGTGRNQAAIYTVPANHCYYLYRIDAFATDSNGGKAASFRNFVRNNVAGTEFRVAETQFFDNMNIQRRFPFKYDQKSDIKLQLKSSSGSISGSVFAEGLLLREPLGS